MIEGLKFDVTSDEMSKHCLDMAAYHAERAKFYADKADALEQGNAEGMNYTGGDPVRALKDKRTEHEHKSHLFNFLQTHIVVGETYRLTESELIKLELVRNKGWY